MVAMAKTILSGMRPSGKLHLGNYWGALSRWLELQDGGDYSCYFMVADLHALTTGYAETKGLSKNVEDMVLDWLAAGLDPERSVIFLQSKVKEHAELALLFSMITPLGWLERIPTYKEQLREMSEREIATHGFLGYPVLQTADILLYKADGVPVGEDQLSHVELTQEIARRFNRLYGAVFAEPKALLSPSPRVPGLDTRKMSKSYGNAIELADPPDELWKKIQRAYTDPKKIRKNDKGNPHGCVVYALHKIYNSESGAVERECSAGDRGCVDCKKQLLGLMEPALRPLQERRKELEKKPGAVWDVLEAGNKKARERAEQTLTEVRQAIGLS
jgi:tryptophanyl-tRNA synthetase